MPTKTWSESWKTVLRWRSRSKSVGWGSFTVSPQPNQIFGATVTTDGPVTDYKGKIARGESATTNLHAAFRKLGSPTSGYAWRRIERNSDKFWYEDELYGRYSWTSTVPTDPAGFEIQSVKNDVIVKVLQQIRDAQTSLQGLVTAGELGQTGRMLHDAGKRLRGGLDDYLNQAEKLARHLSRRRVIGAMSDLWLEWHFGWKPTMRDIEDALEGIKKHPLRIPRVLVRSKGESMVKTPPTTESANYSGILVSNTISIEKRYSCKIYGRVEIPQKDLTWAREFGFSSREFLPSLYELIPYSFLVDYFSNLGSIIDSLCINTAGVKWLAMGTKSEFALTSTPHVDSQVNSSHSKKGLSWSCEPYTLSRVELVRQPFYPYMLRPSLQFRIPGTDTRWLNIAALASSHKRVLGMIRR